jgi:hypothetical protein
MMFNLLIYAYLLYLTLIVPLFKPEVRVSSLKNRAENTGFPCLPSVAILNIKFLSYFTIIFFSSLGISGLT